MSVELAAPSSTCQQERPLALIADKDASIRELLTELFRDIGWDTQTVPLPLWPEDVLDLHPQILLLELGQSEAAEALHFAAALSHAFRLAHLQIVFTSTDHTLLDRVGQCAAWSDFQVLPKPFTYDELLERLRAADNAWREQASRERALGA